MKVLVSFIETERGSMVIIDHTFRILMQKKMI
jgi:hypothetical protein